MADFKYKTKSKSSKNGRRNPRGNRKIIEKITDVIGKFRNIVKNYMKISAD